MVVSRPERYVPKRPNEVWILDFVTDQTGRRYTPAGLDRRDVFSRPGKPTDNSSIETFNGSLRDECLSLRWFESLSEAKQEIEAWRQDYNESRPHMTLNDLAPDEFSRKYSLRHPVEGFTGVDD